MYKEKISLSAEIKTVNLTEETVVFTDVSVGNLLKLKKIMVKRHGDAEILLDMPMKQGDDVFCFCDAGFEVAAQKTVAEVVNQQLTWEVPLPKAKDISLNPEKIVANIWQKREKNGCDTLLARADAVLDGKIMLLGLEIHCLRGNLFLLYPSLEKEQGIEPFIDFLSSDYGEKVEKVVINAFKNSGMFLGPIRHDSEVSADSAKKALFPWGSIAKKKGVMG